MHEGEAAVDGDPNPRATVTRSLFEGGTKRIAVQQRVPRAVSRVLRHLDGFPHSALAPSFCQFAASTPAERATASARCWPIRPRLPSIASSPKRLRAAELLTRPAESHRKVHGPLGVSLLCIQQETGLIIYITEIKRDAKSATAVQRVVRPKSRTSQPRCACGRGKRIGARLALLRRSRLPSHRPRSPRRRAHCRVAA